MTVVEGLSHLKGETVVILADSTVMVTAEIPLTTCFSAGEAFVSIRVDLESKVVAWSVVK